MDLLPDLVLLEIFEKLDFRDLCACSRVCQRWYSATQSSRLKRSIIITNELSTSQVFSLIHGHCSQQLAEFALLQRSDISRDALLELSNKCPNLKKLYLEKCILLDDCTIIDVPSTLQHLSFRCSKITGYFFQPLRELHFASLTCLDVSYVWIHGYDYFVHISKLKKLRCLYLQRSSIGDTLVPSLFDILPQLHVLDVEGNAFTNKGVKNIISHCTAIRELYIGHLEITDGALINFSVNTHSNLSILCVKRTSVTPQRIQQFMKDRRKISIGYEFHPYRGLPMRGCSHYLSHSCPGVS